MFDINLPSAIPPIYQTINVNSEIIIYEGNLVAVIGDDEISTSGELKLVWLPSPNIRFLISNVPTRIIFSSNPVLDIILRLEDGSSIDNCRVTRRQSSNGLNTISGVIKRSYFIGLDIPVKEVRFIIPNLPHIRGSAILLPNNACVAGRIEIALEQWLFTLDLVPGYKQIIDDLENYSGYGITHSGKITKQDGSLFRLADIQPILNSFYWCFSFALGYRVGALLFEGLSSEQSRVFQFYNRLNIDPFLNRAVKSFSDLNEPNIFIELFVKLFALWNDQEQSSFWQEVLATSIDWYLAANNLSDTIDSAIIQTQIAFELLSSVILVEHNQLFSMNEYRRLSTSGCIRSTLEWAQISLNIPPDLSVLSERANTENWSDTADAMAKIRNKIIHPTKNNRELLANNSIQARYEIWNLGMWSLELCILRLLNYRGQYSNRLGSPWQGDVEDVPWSLNDSNDSTETIN